MLYAIKEHNTVVNGIGIRWTEMGRISRKSPVVLIHGLNNSRFSWSCVAPYLARDRRVYMLDLPGHGESDRPDLGYELEWYAKVVAAWMKEVGIQNADVVGHSFGGGVAQMLLLECPKRVRRLVLIAAGGLGKGVGVWLRLASLPYLVERLGQPFMGLGAKLVLRNLRGKLNADEITRLVRFNSIPGSARAFARTVRDVIDWRGQRRGFLTRAHEVKKLPPVLVLWGDKDNLIPMQQGREFTETVKGSVLKVFRGCGHFLHNEEPEQVALSVRKFLDDPKARPTELVVTPTQADAHALGIDGALPVLDGPVGGADLEDEALPSSIEAATREAVATKRALPPPGASPCAGPSVPTS